MTVVTGQSAASSATTRKETAGTTARPSIHTEITVTQTDTTGVAEINVTWDLDLSINTFEQSYDTSAYTPTDSDNLDISTPGELIWKDRFGTPATATFRYEASQDRGSGQKQEHAVTDDWGFVRPDFRYGLYYNYDSGFSLEPTTQNISVEGAGTAGNVFAYLGEYDEFKTSVNGESIRLVVADHVTVDGPALLARIARASERLAIGGSVTEESDILPQSYASNNREVTVFIASDPIHNSFALDSDCVITESRTEESLIHEYVHTQQLYHQLSEIEWTVEASASYFSHRFDWAEGSITTGDFRVELVSSGGSVSWNDVELANEETWKGTLANYNKGERVLAALDAKIQTATENREHLGTVFERLNAVDRSELTARSVQEIAENVAETDLTQFFESYVRGRETPQVPTVDELTQLTADFTVKSADINAGNELTLEADVSTPEPGDEIDRYDWDLGDETTQTGQTVSHSYDEPGDYDVSLRVRSGEKVGRHTESVIKLAVEIEVEKQGYGFKVGDKVSMTASITPPRSVQRYELDFGDGTTQTITQVERGEWESDDGTYRLADLDDAPRHTYDEPGVYDVKLEVVTDKGTATAVRQITIETAIDSDSGANQSTEATDNTPDRSTEAELNDDTPGFGVGTAVAAVSGAVHLLRRRLDEKSDDSGSE